MASQANTCETASSPYLWVRAPLGDLADDTTSQGQLTPTAPPWQGVRSFKSADIARRASSGHFRGGEEKMHPGRKVQVRRYSPSFIDNLLVRVPGLVFFLSCQQWMQQTPVFLHLTSAYPDSWGCPGHPRSWGPLHIPAWQLYIPIKSLLIMEGALGKPWQQDVTGEDL